MNMNTGTKARIALLVVILLATWAIEAGADLITLEFDVSIHGRPCRVIVSQVETAEIDPDADAPRYTTIWEIEVIEMDDSPPTVTPTVNPTVSPTVSPTITPSTNGYASLKTSTVYHKADCRYVVNRLPEELDLYATCEEAIASGKRACKTCDPCQ